MCFLPLDVLRSEISRCAASQTFNRPIWLSTVELAIKRRFWTSDATCVGVRIWLACYRPSFTEHCFGKTFEPGRKTLKDRKVVWVLRLEAFRHVICSGTLRASGKLRSQRFGTARSSPELQRSSGDRLSKDLPTDGWIGIARSLFAFSE